MKNRTKLVRKQLNKTLLEFRPILGITIPPKGWIRAIRDSLGMSGRQLAGRLGVTRQRVSEIERGELPGSVTLKSMRKVADCLDCVFVYAFVPQTSLEHTVHDRAKQVAEERLQRASQLMLLEGQELNEDDELDALSDMIEEMIETQPSTLWDE
ncbi:MAG: mobile mystery protein A [Chloroflexota bacterium]|nr:mobile mystery protein A [Chloroflexota bacterium]